ncbi:uncharacterized protein LOC143855449 [Tasmannia lanceolata]|uniref:uncharacterized protein LOC143855449 n=1 Tax=Tasmannia lanceolata TaxID=3420 RepID=UPI0040644190
MANNFGYKFLRNCKTDRFCKWIPPIPGEFKLNSYASLSDEGGGIGGIIRDSIGDAIYCFSLSIPKGEIYSLEIHAICTGVAAAMALGITKLWIEADSTFVVASVDKSSHPTWKNLPDIKKAWSYLDSIDWRISHIWREANSAANYLSKISCPYKGENIPIHSILCL